MALPITVTSETFDLTTASGATWNVRMPNGDRVSWSASWSASSATEAVTTHIFTGSDTPETGVLVIEIVLTIPGGNWPVHSFQAVVYDPLAAPGC